MPSLWPLSPQSLEGKVDRLCKSRPEAAHSLSHKRQEMMDSWRKVWIRAQKWYESLGLSPMLNGLPCLPRLQFSIHTLPFDSFFS